MVQQWLFPDTTIFFKGVLFFPTFSRLPDLLQNSRLPDLVGTLDIDSYPPILSFLHIWRHSIWQTILCFQQLTSLCHPSQKVSCHWDPQSLLVDSLEGYWEDWVFEKRGKNEVFISNMALRRKTSLLNEYQLVNSFLIYVAQPLKVTSWILYCQPHNKVQCLPSCMESRSLVGSIRSLETLHPNGRWIQ